MCSQTHCEQLENQITELSARIHAATYRLLELIREYDDSHGWCGPGLNSCAHWLNRKCGINPGAARGALAPMFEIMYQDTHTL